jgi:hypothetical protein
MFLKLVDAYSGENRENLTKSQVKATNVVMDILRDER